MPLSSCQSVFSSPLMSFQKMFLPTPPYSCHHPTFHSSLPSPPPSPQDPPSSSRPHLGQQKDKNLESQVHKLSREVLAMSNKLATGVYGSTNKMMKSLTWTLPLLLKPLPLRSPSTSKMSKMGRPVWMLPIRRNIGGNGQNRTRVQSLLIKKTQTCPPPTGWVSWEPCKLSFYLYLYY